MNADYLNLRKKIADTFAAIALQNKAKMACKKGCSSCCLPGLTVSPVEFEFIKEHLAKLPELLNSTLAEEQSRSVSPKSCPFLDQGGSCTIYDVRPIICMSHGVPVKFRTSDRVDKSVCHLNFKDGLSELADSSFLNLDLINSILALINAKDYPNQNTRHLLAPSSFT
jgi:Fe-S-cluster containining protein